VLTKNDFKQAARLTDALADKWYFSIITAVNQFLSYTPLRMAHILAQLGHESEGFVHLEENLMYQTQDRILEVFGKRNGLSSALASQFVRNPEALADFVYGGVWGAQHLGNTEPGDGYKFRGSGLIQITGKSNFLTVANSLNMQLDTLPELMRTNLEIAATAAIWWICEKGLLTYFDRDDLAGSTRVINGSLASLVDRQQRLNYAKNILC